MTHILLASVLYPTHNFESFLYDLLSSIKQQTYKKFSILLFLDGIQASRVKVFVKTLKFQQQIIYQGCEINTLTPSQIRHKIIQTAYNLSYDILIFCDFDEKIFTNRIEQTLKIMQKNIDFTYCNACITDKNFNPISNLTFFQSKDIPNLITNINPILTKNFIGMGGLALRLNKTSLYKLEIPENIQAFDWFLATHMLLNNWIGKKIEQCLVYYRQHENNHIGTNNALDEEKMYLGLLVKKKHYQYFSRYDEKFTNLYKKIIETEKYIKQNKNKYIKIINTHFNPDFLCWWENIKTLEEIQQWI